MSPSMRRSTWSASNGPTLPRSSRRDFQLVGEAAQELQVVFEAPGWCVLQPAPMKW